jgi:hypothetical protein
MKKEIKLDAKWCIGIQNHEECDCPFISFLRVNPVNLDNKLERAIIDISECEERRKKLILDDDRGEFIRLENCITGGNILIYESRLTTSPILTTYCRIKRFLKRLLKRRNGCHQRRGNHEKRD